MHVIVTVAAMLAVQEDSRTMIDQTGTDRFLLSLLFYGLPFVCEMGHEQDSSEYFQSKEILSP